MSDGAKADYPSRLSKAEQVMAVDEDKKGNSEEHNPQQMRVETMEEAPLFSEFSGSGRTGRRNALPNIMQESVAAIGTSAITEMLDQLTCASGGVAGAGGGPRGGTGGAPGVQNSRPDEEMGACGGAEAAPNQRLNPS